MNVLLDTHTLFWLFTSDKRISNKAKLKFREAKKVFIPTIVLLELLYLLKKKRLNDQFSGILNQLKAEGRINFISLDIAIVENMPDTDFRLEMHDSAIVTSAHILDLPIITKDRAIRKIYKNTIW